ncbi:MAG: FAD-binding oxidoreductase [Candidatus Aminicenantia bacterium]
MEKDVRKIRKIMIDKKIIKQLKKIVGSQWVYLSPEERLCYSYDAARQESLPEVVVKPSSAEEISQILKLANQYLIPIYPRGAGTGMSGGSVPLEGGIALVMTRMNRILEIDTENLTATVEPGVITADLQKAVEKKGLFYPPDPASVKFSTIGGNVAESAGGLRCLKYGTTKDYILKLEAVLPTGEIITTGAKTMKSVVGYDLTRLLVGSEGTLAVITKITIKLIPQPEFKKTMMVTFNDILEAGQTVSDIIKNNIIPSALEFIDREGTNCLREYAYPELTPAGALLLVELDGSEEEVVKDVEKVRQICQKNEAQNIEVAASEKESEKIWDIRRAISPSLYQIAPHKINEDICVPRSKIPEMIKIINQISEQSGLKIITFGHAGDGNLHVNIMTDLNQPGEREKVNQSIKKLFQAALNLEGTISGEHGIGTTKSSFLSMEIGKVELELMKKIKKVLDPNNILNPGKIFPEN